MNLDLSQYSAEQIVNELSNDKVREILTLLTGNKRRRDETTTPVEEVEKSHLKPTSGLCHAVKFVEDATGMLAVVPGSVDYGCCWNEGCMLIEFRSTDESRLDQKARVSVRETLKNQGYSIRFWDEHGIEVNDDDDGIEVNDDDTYDKLSIEFKVLRVFHELQDFIKARVQASK
jgi:hypothetical protein